MKIKKRSLFKAAGILLLAFVLSVSCNFNGASSQPEEPSITIDGSKKFLQKKTDYYLHFEFKNFSKSGYKLQECIKLFIDNKLTETDDFKYIGDNTLQIDVYSLKPGKHNMFIRVDDENVSSNTLELEIFEEKIAPEIKVQKILTNTINLSCENLGYEYYYFYVNTVNDYSTATKIDECFSDYTQSLDYLVPEENSDCKLYFWIAGTDSYKDEIDGKIFSDVAEYDYIKESITTSPKGLKVANAPVLRNGINVTWNNNNTPHYVIYVYDAEDNLISFYNVKEYSVDGYTIIAYPDIYTTDTCYFSIKSYCYDRDEENPESEKVKYNFTYKKPDAPKGVSVEKAPEDKMNRVRIKWTGNDALCHYIYYNLENDPSKAIKCGYHNNNTDLYYDVAVPDNGTYYFWVKAADIYYEGNKIEDDPLENYISSPVTYTFTDYNSQGLSTPENVKVESISPALIQMSWDEVTKPAEIKSLWYSYYCNTENNFLTATMINQTSNIEIYCQKSDFEPNVKYYFWVRAINGFNGTKGSSYSNPVEFVPNTGN